MKWTEEARKGRTETELWKEEENRKEDQVGERRVEEQGGNRRVRITEGN